MMHHLCISVRLVTAPGRILLPSAGSTRPFCNRGGGACSHQPCEADDGSAGGHSDATSWLAVGESPSRRTEWLCLTHDGQMAFRRTTRGGHITWSCNVPFSGVPKMFWIFCSFESGGHLPYIPLFHHHVFSYLSWFNQPTNTKNLRAYHDAEWMR